MNLKELARTERARRNLAQKIFLEKRFTPELLNYFRSISRQFASFYAKTGQILTQDQFSEKTKNILNRQYNRVAVQFSNDMRMGGGNKSLFLILYKEKETTEEKVDSAIDEAILLFILQSTKSRSKMLDQTTITDLTKSVDEAFKVLQDSEAAGEAVTITNKTIADEASKIANKKFESRVPTISLSETAFMAESVKAIEASAIDSTGHINIGNVIGGMALLPGDVFKAWGSVGDGKVRENHIVADGQRVKINQPFIVGGELLMYPTDTSLGASVGNVANCRCSSNYAL
jgi:hypothetical protein